jgi:hypothetical protein
MVDCEGCFAAGTGTAKPVFMAHYPIFDSAQNQALLVVCARKTIRTAAIAGIVWGSINLVVGYFAVLANPLNAGILVLGLLMIGTGITGLRKPSLSALLSEAIVSILLLCWNVAITVINLRAGLLGTSGHGLILPAIAAVIFFRQYQRLGHLREAIATLDHATVKEASGLCQELFKSNLKETPEVAECARPRFRLRLMGDSVFCAQKNLARAFHLNRDTFRQCVPRPEKKLIRIVIPHPLGKLTYAFDRKNSEKIKGWLAAPPQTS